MVVKPPSGTTPPILPNQTSSQPAEQTTQTRSASPAATVMNPEAVAKALKDYQTLRKKLNNPSFLKGAAGLFTDNVLFPEELLDPHDPLNDPKYLHLLFAVFGMKEMKKFFATEDQNAEEEAEESCADEEASSDPVSQK